MDGEKKGTEKGPSTSDTEATRDTVSATSGEQTASVTKPSGGSATSTSPGALVAKSETSALAVQEPSIPQKRAPARAPSTADRFALAHRQRMTSMYILAGAALSAIIVGGIVAVEVGAVPALLLFSTALFCLVFIAPLGTGQRISVEESRRVLSLLRKQNAEQETEEE